MIRVVPWVLIVMCLGWVVLTNVRLDRLEGRIDKCFVKGEGKP